MIFRQLFDPRSSTYTYLLADEWQAVIIDPVFEHARRDAALVRELGLTLLTTLETHVHADHVTGGWRLKKMLGCDYAVAASSGAKGADRYLVAGDRVAFGDRFLEVRATPGHTSGCLTFVLDDQSRAFTGDALLIRGAGRTDFQQGSASRLFDSIQEQIFTLPSECLLYPAHDYGGRTCTSVAEERAHNPRIGGERSRADFIGYMENLNLPHPRQIDAAVPANLVCGKPEQDPGDSPEWAELQWSYAGLWQVRPESLFRVLDDVDVVDVREPEEYDGPLGHIADAQLLPLGLLLDNLDELNRERPIVTVCRSGGRSAQAAVLLGKQGFERVANLEGGMLAWCDQGLPVAL